MNSVTENVGITSPDLMETVLSLDFGDRANLFVHEYYSFATSKFDTLAEWDENTKYEKQNKLGKAVTVPISEESVPIHILSKKFKF